MSSEYRRLWLLVEGADDRRFCTEVLTPFFRATFDHVAIWDYSQKKDAKLTSLIRSIDSMNDHYLLFGDIDERPCVTATKEYLVNQFSVPAWDRIVVVRREIEAWYLAGLDDEACRDLGLDGVSNVDVDAVTKEQFDRLVGGKVKGIRAQWWTSSSVTMQKSPARGVRRSGTSGRNTSGRRTWNRNP